MRNLAMVVALSLAACSDGSPLGGPYGGTDEPPPPSSHGPQPSGQDAGGSPSGDGGNAAADSSVSSSTTSGATWSGIWTSYFAKGTQGNCASSGCHTQMASASSAYSFLQGKGYISGTTSSLVDPSRSCLSWYGGNMPPSGPTSLPAATKDLSAWVAAGAPNN